MSKKLLIFIPAYNNEKHIEQVIKLIPFDEIQQICAAYETRNYKVKNVFIDDVVLMQFFYFLSSLRHFVGK